MLVHETRDAEGRPTGLRLAEATPRAWLAAGRADRRHERADELRPGLVLDRLARRAAPTSRSTPRPAALRRALSLQAPPPGRPADRERRDRRQAVPALRRARPARSTSRAGAGRSGSRLSTGGSARRLEPRCAASLRSSSSSSRWPRRSPPPRPGRAGTGGEAPARTRSTPEHRPPEVRGLVTLWPITYRAHDGTRAPRLRLAPDVVRAEPTTRRSRS